jgi:hypothetical protein
MALSTASGHPLVINGDLAATGNIDLTAGPPGPAIPRDQINFAQNATSSGGNITVNANAVTGAQCADRRNVTSNLYVAPAPGSTPTLADCIANPALSGCAGMLPVSSCLHHRAHHRRLFGRPAELWPFAPSPIRTAGCSAVLPALAVCIGAPSHRRLLGVYCDRAGGLHGQPRHRRVAVPSCQV